MDRTGTGTGTGTGVDKRLASIDLVRAGLCASEALRS